MVGLDAASTQLRPNSAAKVVMDKSDNVILTTLQSVVQLVRILADFSANFASWSSSIAAVSDFKISQTSAEPPSEIVDCGCCSHLLAYISGNIVCQNNGFLICVPTC